MGAKTWMLSYADADARQALATQHQLNREASVALATKLFPLESLEPLADGNLFYTNPPDDELLVGCYNGVAILAAKEFGIDYSSALPQEFIDPGGHGEIYLHAMHSVVDWFAFARWSNGKLVRALSLSSDDGVIEDIGPRMTFEEPYWAGKHPVFDDDEPHDDYPFAFHPLELGEAALLEFFGYQIEGFVVAAQLDPESISLLRFKRVQPRRSWKFWR